MKQTFRKLFLALGALGLIGGGSVQACTNFLITKGASKDGSTMISYAADSHVLYGELYYRPAADYPEGTMMDIYEWDTGRKLGQIKQALHTYSVVGNINEHQVAIGETTFGGLPQLVDTTGIIDYGSLIYITLQRAKTAREAIKIMHELTSTYGYASASTPNATPVPYGWPTGFPTVISPAMPTRPASPKSSLPTARLLSAAKTWPRNTTCRAWNACTRPT